MYEMTIDVEGARWRAQLDDGIRLSIPLEFDGDQPKAFGLADAERERVVFGDTVCDTDQGGAFNCSAVTLIPHGNGTHTESLAHLRTEAPPVGELVQESLFPCTLLTVSPVTFDATTERYNETATATDSVVTRASLAEAYDELDPADGFLRSLVVRTEPNEPGRRNRDYSETNPPYLTREALRWVRARGVEHLLVDLPSIDRESDGGRLANHRAFWGIADGGEASSRRTLTEFCYIPNALPDGRYFVDIQVPDFSLDAAPSRPLLYEATRID